MNADQFALFVQAEQDDRAAARQAAQTQHQERQASNLETAGRQKAEAQAKRVPACDGASTKEVREWIREVEFTIPYSNRTVYIAAKTAEGPLRREIERFLNTQPNRNNVTWQQLKAHVQNSFLSPHEEDQLRDDVQKLKESSYEGTASYSRRFRDAADLGYPPAQRNADQHRIMKDAYLRGLKDEKLVERLVKEGRPATFQDAIDLVDQYSADDYQLQRTIDGVGRDYRGSRQEEPMEIGAVTPGPDADTQALRKDVDLIKRQVGGITQQINKLHAVIGAQGPSAPPRKKNNSKYQFTSDGLPICVKCGQPGHVIRECRANRPRREKESRPAQGPSHQGGQ